VDLATQINSGQTSTTAGMWPKKVNMILTTRSAPHPV